jgi:hypothetical protein
MLVNSKPDLTSVQSTPENLVRLFEITQLVMELKQEAWRDTEYQAQEMEKEIARLEIVVNGKGSAAGQVVQGMLICEEYGKPCTKR